MKEAEAIDIGQRMRILRARSSFFARIARRSSTPSRSGARRTWWCWRRAEPPGRSPEPRSAGMPGRISRARSSASGSSSSSLTILRYFVVHGPASVATAICLCRAGRDGADELRARDPAARHGARASRGLVGGVAVDHRSGFGGAQLESPGPGAWVHRRVRAQSGQWRRGHHRDHLWTGGHRSSVREGKRIPATLRSMDPLVVYRDSEERSAAGSAKTERAVTAFLGAVAPGGVLARNRVAVPKPRSPPGERGLSPCRSVVARQGRARLGQ
jgi:hypothetical protein